MTVASPILLDVSRLVWRAWDRKLPTGIDRTCLAYAAHYADQALAVIQRGGVTRVIGPDASRALLRLLVDRQPDFRRRLLAMIPALMTSGASRADVAGAVYLNVGHTGLNFSGHKAWLKRSGVRPVYFLHDLIPLTHPEFCRPGEPDKHLDRINALLDHGVGIIANSQETLSELAGFVTLRRGLQLPPSLVAPLGVETSICRSAASNPLAKSYFLMLGTIEGRKNHLMMLNVWADVARIMGADCPTLVIIGQRGWESEQAVDMLERSDRLHGHVIELSRAGDETVSRFMTHARALLFPSFVEGYGLPLVEALACRTPVIASDLTVFVELAGNVPDYVSPIDGLRWRDHVIDYAQPGSERREAQLRRMDDLRLPNWDEHFAQVNRWMRTL